MARCQLTTENSDDPSVFALHRNPLIIGIDTDGGETDLDIKLIGLEQQILHYVARHFRVGLEKNAKGKEMMYVSLTDIKYLCIIFRQNGCQRRRHSRPVIAGNMDKDQFYVSHLNLS